MGADASLDMNRFYLKAAFLVGALALAVSLRFPREVFVGVLAGGALSIINIREMHKGLRVVLRMEKPSALRLLFSGIFRLIILASVIILIAALKLVNLLGLLIGFAIVPIVLLLEGLLHARKLQAIEEREATACSTKPPNQ